MTQSGGWLSPSCRSWSEGGSVIRWKCCSEGESSPSCPSMRILSTRLLKRYEIRHQMVVLDVTDNENPNSPVSLPNRAPSLSTPLENIQESVVLSQRGDKTSAKKLGFPLQKQPLQNPVSLELVRAFPEPRKALRACHAPPSSLVWLWTSQDEKTYRM